jgi:uncharacterized protein (TIGR03032 family)
VTGTRLAAPVFVVAGPGPGGALLLDALARSPDLWRVGDDDPGPAPSTVEALVVHFESRLRDRRGRRPAAHLTGLRVLDGSPENAGRVPFLAAAFPDARFVHVRGGPDDGAGTDLEALGPDRWCATSDDELAAEPAAEVERICRFLGVRWDAPPRPATMPVAVDDGSFGSDHTSSFPTLLAQLGVSVVASTYQSGRLITLRHDAGGLNTHFRTFDTPMGLAVRHGRLVVGTRTAVWDHRDHAALAPRIEPRGRHDACYVPRSCTVTGDIRVHDLEVAGGETWVVNTAFSCLATLDGDHSFVPRWRPPWITALAAEDRCHLNGLAVVEERPKYVTALGRTDSAGGWREHKASGGVVVDVETNEVVADGLCMPHSPRWHDGRLWVLESGNGTLATVDVGTGAVTVVAELPGFTRGLTFAGPFAFVGLSLVRERLFDGVPIVGRDDLACGVWAVDTRTGDTAFVRFSGTVQEIFDVRLLPHRFPEVLEPSDPRLATSFLLP